MSSPDPLDLYRAWFRSKGWEPWAFQEDAWRAAASGHSGLIHVPTGAGKTYAAFIGPLSRLTEPRRKGLRILYITPLRAISRDMAKALERPLTELELGYTVGSRTGDTKASERARQRKALPHILVTTPESLSLMIADASASDRFAGVEAVIVDEWHELLGNKRGTQVELALARIRRLAPKAVTWALSATLSNLAEAAQVVTGLAQVPTVVTGDIERPLLLDSLLPAKVDAFPWAGHLGLSMQRKLAQALDPEQSTLVFTNTRSQAEVWFRALSEQPELKGTAMAIHHGSIGLEEREAVEAGLKSGAIKLCVATSSLDLGVDFTPVERVVQIGSPKGIARLLQRAGRSGHQPGASCRLTFVPTNSLELLEIAAAREALHRGEVEARTPLSKPLDVLTQHLVTRALGGGFAPEELLSEVRSAVSYRDLTEEEFQWSLDLVESGGATLGAYPDYHRVKRISDAQGQDQVVIASDKMARLHRMNIGTISSDSDLQVRFSNGKWLGSVEEGFVARLRKGDRFIFAGRTVSLVRVTEGVATVKAARRVPDSTPRWMGGRMPLSTCLADAMRRIFSAGEPTSEEALPQELIAARPLLQAQREISELPSASETLAELCTTRDGHHLFLYPFAGRLVHEGLASLLAYRMTRNASATLSLSVNDYGIEFLAAEPFAFRDALTAADLFSMDSVDEDIRQCINLSEMSKRQFRGVARVSGLVLQNYPGRKKGSRQLQTSASLLFDVFTRYDPASLLLHQAEREVLEAQFEQSRMEATLQRLSKDRLSVVHTERPSPLAFPLLVDRMRARVSSETLKDRIERLKAMWTS